MCNPQKKILFQYKFLLLTPSLIVFLVAGCATKHSKFPLSKPLVKMEVRNYFFDCSDTSYKMKLDAVWEKAQPILFNSLKGGLDKHQPTAIYNAELRTIALLRTSHICAYTDFIDKISQYLIIPFSYIQERDNIKTWRNVNGTEFNILSSSQFLYVVSFAIKAISALEPSSRSQAMLGLIKHLHVVVFHHYKRWLSNPIFSVMGWGCQQKTKKAQKGVGYIRYNHHKLLKQKLGRKLRESPKEKPYCNGITDVDLWIPAGISEIFIANKNDPTLVPLKPELQKDFASYIKTAFDLIQDRTKVSNYKNRNGEKRQGFEFDHGIWDTHPDYAYSAYVESNYPSKKPKRKANIGWDISHGARFVHVFDSFVNANKILGHGFPKEDILQALANQYIDRTFNSDYERPLFSNYLDGTNGWYRAYYGGKRGTGYPPWGLSRRAILGGYGFLSPYREEIKIIFNRIHEMMNSKNKEEKLWFEKNYGEIANKKELAILELTPQFLYQKKN